MRLVFLCVSVPTNVQGKLGLTQEAERLSLFGENFLCGLVLEERTFPSTFPSTLEGMA